MVRSMVEAIAMATMMLVTMLIMLVQVLVAKESGEHCDSVADVCVCKCWCCLC